MGDVLPAPPRAASSTIPRAHPVSPRVVTSAAASARHGLAGRGVLKCMNGKGDFWRKCFWHRGSGRMPLRLSLRDRAFDLCTIPSAARGSTFRLLTPIRLVASAKPYAAPGCAPTLHAAPRRLRPRPGRCLKQPRDPRRPGPCAPAHLGEPCPARPRNDPPPKGCSGRLRIGGGGGGDLHA